MLWFMRGDAISDELIEIVHGESFDKSAAAAPFDDKSFRLQMIQCPFDRHFAGLIDLFQFSGQWQLIIRLVDALCDFLADILCDGLIFQQSDSPLCMFYNKVYYIF